MLEFTIEKSGAKFFPSPLGGSVTVPHLCNICAKEIDGDEPIVRSLTSYGYVTRICRECLKNLAIFIDDNRTSILSM